MVRDGGAASATAAAVVAVDIGAPSAYIVCSPVKIQLIVANLLDFTTEPRIRCSTSYTTNKRAMGYRWNSPVVGGPDSCNYALD